MTEEEFVELLDQGHERGGVEFKGSFARTNATFQAKVIRAMLGMANRRDGGVVIIGVNEFERQLQRDGLSDDDLRTWNFDDVAAALARYADPSIRFSVGIHRHDERNFVVLQVDEFDEYPIICRSDFQEQGAPRGTPNILRAGACYVRSRRKPETTEIPTHEDMRALLDLATEKRLRAFFANLRAIGADVQDLAERTHRRQYERQLGDFR